MVINVLTLGFQRFKLAGDPFDPTGVIGAGLSFIGGLVSNHNSKTIAREQMRQQESLFNTQLDYTKAAEQRQYDYADKVWDRETAYNDPVAQRERFQNAGLNPAMMMQGQNAVVGSSMDVSSPSSPTPPSPAGGYEYHDPITPAVNTYLQSQLLGAQTKKTEEEAAQVGIDNRTRETKNLLDLVELRQRIETLIDERKKTGAETDLLKRQADALDQEITFLDMTLDYRVRNEKFRAYLTKKQGEVADGEALKLAIDNFWLDAEHELNHEIARATKRRIESQILVDRSTSSLNDSTARKMAAEYSKTILEAAELVPGNRVYKRKDQVLKAQIYNLLKGKINLFGLGFDVPQTTSGFVFGDY